MPQVTMRVDDGEVKTILQRAGLAVRNLPAKVLRREMEVAREEVRDYPAPLPGQRYVRTGKRYAATKVERVDAHAYRLVSDPRYKFGRRADPYVIGDALGQGQARIHRGRWALMADVMKETVKRVVALGEQYFRDVLERNGAP